MQLLKPETLEYCTAHTACMFLGIWQMVNQHLQNLALSARKQSNGQKSKMCISLVTNMMTENVEIDGYLVDHRCIDKTPYNVSEVLWTSNKHILVKFTNINDPILIGRAFPFGKYYQVLHPNYTSHTFTQTKG
jgi:hypothetical protein